MSKASPKQKDYDAAMQRQNEGGRSVLSGMADPFSEYALSDFTAEVEILEALGKAWKMQFCQATMGFSRRPGGLWVAYSADRQAKSILHVEKFVGKSTDHDDINFWASDILQGKLYSGAFRLPFVIIVAFDDGRFALRFDGEPPIQADRIGERVRKGKDYESTTNLVSYFSMMAFKSLAVRRTSAE